MCAPQVLPLPVLPLPAPVFANSGGSHVQLWGHPDELPGRCCNSPAANQSGSKEAVQGAAQPSGTVGIICLYPLVFIAVVVDASISQDRMLNEYPPFCLPGYKKHPLGQPWALQPAAGVCQHLRQLVWLYASGPLSVSPGPCALQRSSVCAPEEVQRSGEGVILLDGETGQHGSLS